MEGVSDLIADVDMGVRAASWAAVWKSIMKAAQCPEFDIKTVFSSASDHMFLDTHCFSPWMRRRLSRNPSATSHGVVSKLSLIHI